MVAIQHAFDTPAAPLDVAAARAEVNRLRVGLPDSLLATRPDEIRRLARRALEAEAAARRRREKVGPPPEVDDAAVDAALSAHAAVRVARAGMTAATAEGMRLLAIGNAWGVSGIGAAAVLLRNGFEPMSSPIFLVVVGAAAGPVATAALGLSRRSFAAMRVAAATNAWADAVRSAGAHTMGELGARRIAMRAWERRRDEADAATAVAREARAAWHRVVGPKRHPRQAPELVARLAALRAAHLDLFRALVAERMRPRPAPPIADVVEVVEVADVVEVVDVEPSPQEPSRLPVLWVREQPLVQRLRFRGLRLWNRS